MNTDVSRSRDFNFKDLGNYRPVYIENRVCVVKDAFKCSFEYLSVVHYTLNRTYPSLSKGLKLTRNNFLHNLILV